MEFRFGRVDVDLPLENGGEEGAEPEEGDDNTKDVEDRF